MKMAVSTPIDFSWDVEDEIQLFFGLEGLRPFGHNKHFNMALLVDRLSSKIPGKDINSSILWAKLKSMYNLATLDEQEPFPADLETEIDFTLPESFLNKPPSVSGDVSGSTEDISQQEKDESSSKSESASHSSTPVSSVSAGGQLAVVKEIEGSRTRNSTPARQLTETSTGNTGNESSSEPKRTRASTSVQPKRTQFSSSNIDKKLNF
uniref:CSON006075 protein n=1 Tax=Culicoides sonorensis TaxID=179676 RepID=A0A336L8N7_CULSO